MKVKFRRLEPVDLLTIKEHLPISVTTDTAGIIAYDEETHKTVAALIAQDWTVTSVQVHQVILSTMVLRHGWCEEIANYIFTQAGRLKMYGLVPSDNENAISINKKAGFTEIARLKDAYDVGVDFVIMELNRENCVYWKPVVEMAA